MEGQCYYSDKKPPAPRSGWALKEMKMNVNELLTGKGQIIIISGEGEIGAMTTYEGARTLQAIRQRLAKERCHGDRWARAVIVDGYDEWKQPQYVNLDG